MALLHDWMIEADLRLFVLEKLCQMFQEAEIFTLSNSIELLPPNIAARQIHDARLPGKRREMWKDIEKFPKALKKFNLAEFDLIISNTIGPMRWFDKQPHQKHISITYGPYPFLHVDLGRVANRKSIFKFFNRFKSEDQLQFRERHIEYLHNVDILVTSSQRMKNILKETYKVDAELLNFPTDEHFFYPRNEPVEDYHLLVDEIELARGIETVIKTFGYLKDQLIILGEGSQLKNFKQGLPDNVQLVDKNSPANRAILMARCRSLIVPDIRHYNHSVLEALSMHRPVICHRQSCAAEYVDEAVSGLIYDDDSVDGLLPAIFKFDELGLAEGPIKPGALPSNWSFKEEISELVSREMPTAKLESA